MSLESTLHYMSQSLSLREAQVPELARLLGRIETERAQSTVDDRRALASFADAVAGASFEAGAAKAGIEQREKSQARLRTIVLETLEATHKLLDAEQRDKLAYMLRTGSLTI